MKNRALLRVVVVAVAVVITLSMLACSKPAPTTAPAKPSPTAAAAKPAPTKPASKPSPTAAAAKPAPTAAAKPSPTAAPAKPSKVLSWATNPVGTLWYAFAVGYSTFLTKNTGMKFNVSPTSGIPVSVGMVNSAEAELTDVPQQDASDTYRGTGAYKGKPHPNLRTLFTGAEFWMSLLVRGDSKIKSVQDIKGKRVVDFVTMPANVIWIKALLATGGLSLSDVTLVPVADTAESCRKLIEGKLDVTFASVGMGAVDEAVATVGAYVLSFDISPAAVERARKISPYFHPTTIKATGSPLLPKDVNTLALYDFIVTNQKMDDATVTKILEAMWGNYQELYPLQPLFPTIKQQTLASPETPLPWHPAAVTFYKGKKAWTDEMEQLQKKLLAP